jgi:hypothetical protein
MSLSRCSRLLLSFGLFALASCGGRPETAATKSVAIPQTVVKGQGSIGFCWSYTTIGFLESLILKKSGERVDLSEEALGFYRIVEELESMSKRFTAAEVDSPEKVRLKSFEDLEGWSYAFTQGYNPGYPALDSYHLVKKYGAVPEGAWSRKFSRQGTRDALYSSIYKGFAALMRQHGQNGVSRPMILKLLSSSDVFGSEPPRSFVYKTKDGKSKNFKATEFIAELASFDPDSYTVMTSSPENNYDIMVQAIKKTLARGLAVPAGFSILNTPTETTYEDYVMGPTIPESLEEVGGHGVLITDFVNHRGVEGAISAEALAMEVARPSSDLDYMRVKDSASRRVFAQVPDREKFAVMDANYLRALVKKKERLFIMVPKDVVPTLDPR